MPDQIRLLPDNIANQIAAGEVVQRPASVVKELIENALDAGADSITVNFRDGGQTLIEVIDNGRGMNEMDARMAWERHATSKISQAEDLFKLHTFGFRGEALASIAAVAQVEMHTRMHDQDVGIKLVIEASKVRNQEQTACQKGTQIKVKNLFFNIPARRKFLKSITVESKHIIEVFEKTAMSNPKIAMQLNNQGNEVHDFKVGSLEERVLAILGGKKGGQLQTVREETDIISITGFIGSPKMAKRTRGDQYFYANGRFIKSPYFQHAVNSAFEGLIEKDQYPLFVLFFELDPTKIDVNVHPTKTEVKFEEGREIYSILKAVSRKALSTFHDSPSFEERAVSTISFPDEGTGFIPPMPSVDVNREFNPFPQKQKLRVPTDWEKLYEPFRDEGRSEIPEQYQSLESLLIKKDEDVSFIRLESDFVACAIEGELHIVHLRYARERVLYEHYLNKESATKIASQQLLFPRTVGFSAVDFVLVNELLEDINHLGFDVEIFGKNAIIINGTPGDLTKGNEQQILQGMLDDFKATEQDIKLGQREKLIRSLARNASLKTDLTTSSNEINDLLKSLFSCKEPRLTPSGKRTMTKFDSEFLINIFKK